MCIRCDECHDNELKLQNKDQILHNIDSVLH